MFETAEVGRSVDNATYKKKSLKLREELVQLQDSFRDSAKRQFIVVLAGVDGGGKGETVKLLNQWMDPRWLHTNAYDHEETEHHGRPEFWVYWRDLPPRGRIGMFLSAWYSRPILDHVYERIDDLAFEDALNRIVKFEGALANDNAVVIKFWMHLSREAQEKRLRNLEEDPLTEARVSRHDWHNWRRYERFIDTAERVISRTHTGATPWIIVEGQDPNYRDLVVGDTLRKYLKESLAEGKTRSKKSKSAGKRGRTKSSLGPASRTVLSDLEPSAPPMDKETYQEQLRSLQAELHRLHLRAKQRGTASVLLFEGPDAAGKGGAIRRINTALEARNYQVHGVAKPTDEESARHYLWRFWRHIPKDGYIAIFDRSWYGRVLVERVEGFATEEEWRRAFGEINDFENQLTDHGIVLVKYWIHITREEQLRRFKERQNVPHKRWKITDEDWRNREKWAHYEQAAHDMVQYTSTRNARWTLIQGNDKRRARVEVLRTYCERLTEALEA